MNATYVNIILMKIVKIRMVLLVVDDDHDGYDILQSIIRELFCMNIQ